jgi:hypothetical protein
MPKNIRERRMSSASESDENSDKEKDEDKKKNALEKHENDQPKNIKYKKKVFL